MSVSRGTNPPFQESKRRCVSRETIPPLIRVRSYRQISGFGLAPVAAGSLSRGKRPENRSVESSAGRICRPSVSVVAEIKPDLLGRQSDNPGKTHFSVACSQADHHVCAEQGGVGPRLRRRSARNPPCDYASRNQLPAYRKQAAKSLIPARGHPPPVTWQRFRSPRKARTGQRGSSRRQSQGRCGAISSGIRAGPVAEQVERKNATPSLSDNDPSSVVIGSCWPTGPDPSLAGFWLGRFCLAATNKSERTRGNGGVLNHPKGHNRP